MWADMLHHSAIHEAKEESESARLELSQVLDFFSGALTFQEMKFLFTMITR